MAYEGLAVLLDIEGLYSQGPGPFAGLLLSKLQVNENLGPLK